MHDLRGLWPLGKPRQCQRHLRGVGPALILLVSIFSVAYIWFYTRPILATLSAIAFGLAFFALQWNKTRELLIPAAVMAPILSLASLILFFWVLVDHYSTAKAIIVALIFLFEAIVSAYYWVGLMTLYELKKPSSIPNVIVA